MLILHSVPCLLILYYAPCKLILCYVTLLKLLTVSRSFLMESAESFKHKVISKSRGHFILFFPVCVPFISLTCFLAHGRFQVLY